MNIRILSIMLGFLLILSGCSATGERFSQVNEFPKEASTLYIFRESKFFNSAYCPAMYLNDEKIGCLKNGGYIRHKLQPGLHLLEVRKSAFLIGDEPKIEFFSNPGEVVFIEWTTFLNDMMVTPSVGVSASESLVKRSEFEATQKLKSLNES